MFLRLRSTFGAFLHAPYSPMAPGCSSSALCCHGEAHGTDVAMFMMHVRGHIYIYIYIYIHIHIHIYI